MIAQIAFTLLLIVGFTLFGLRIKKIRRNILLGKDVDLSGDSSERWKTWLHHPQTPR